MHEYEIKGQDGQSYTVQLDEEHAKSLGLAKNTPAPPANKARKQPSNKSA